MLVTGVWGLAGESSSLQPKAGSSAKVNVHSLICIPIYSPGTRWQHTPSPSCAAFLQEGGQRLIPSKLRKVARKYYNLNCFYSPNLVLSYSPSLFPSCSLHCHLSCSVWIFLTILSRDLSVQQLISQSITFGQRATVTGGVTFLRYHASNHPPWRTSPASLMSHSLLNDVREKVAKN